MVAHLRSIKSPADWAYMRIAINGAGIAGPTLAYWLRESGHEVLLIEESPQLRSGGYAIDFWGVGYDIAEKMGLLPRIREVGYQVKEVRYVNRHGRKSGGFSVDVFRRMTNGRFTELRRSDLAATIYDALDGQVETIFGDSVARIEDEGNRVRVGFDHAAPREVDLVIGADGLHSRVRRLVFGPESEFEVSLGYHVAAFEIEGYRPRDELVAVGHAVPGRQILRLSLRDDMTLFLFVFRDEYLTAESPSSEQECKSVLTNVFADVGWECARILAAMDDARGVYFDRVSQIRMECWAKGRTALIGDAQLRLPPCRRRDWACHGRGLCSRRRIARLRGRSHRSLRPLSRADDAVSEAQAGVGSEIRFLVCTEEGLRHRVPQPCKPIIANSFHRGSSHRSRGARRRQAARLHVLANVFPADRLSRSPSRAGGARRRRGGASRVAAAWRLRASRGRHHQASKNVASSAATARISATLRSREEPGLTLRPSPSRPEKLDNSDSSFSTAEREWTWSYRFAERT